MGPEGDIGRAECPVKQLHFEGLWVVNENADIGVLRARLLLGLIAGDAASGSALRRWHPCGDLVGITSEDDRFAINENGLVMALADCPPDYEIPTPNRLAVVFPCTESGVPDVIKTDLRDKSINSSFFPGTSGLIFFTTFFEIGDVRYDPVEGLFIVRERHTTHVVPIAYVDGVHDLSDLPTFCPSPTVVNIHT